MKTVPQDASPTPPALAAETGDRRNRTRIVPYDPLEAVFSSAPKKPQLAVVEDMSFAGIAVRIGDASGLAVGQELYISILNQSMPTVIRNIVRLSEGGYRVGAEFIDPDLQQVTGVLEEFLAS
jgi:hypothetical protein